MGQEEVLANLAWKLLTFVECLVVEACFFGLASGHGLLVLLSFAFVFCKLSLYFFD